MENGSLDDWDSLLVRECKRNVTSMRRLKRILGWRCGLDWEGIPTQFVAEMLLDIIAGCNLVSLSKLITREMAPAERWKHYRVECSDPYYADVISAARSVLHLTKVKRLPGFRSGTRWARRPRPKFVQPRTTLCPVEGCGVPQWAFPNGGVSCDNGHAFETCQVVLYKDPELRPNGYTTLDC